jgi:hypothetical protein
MNTGHNIATPNAAIHQEMLSKSFFGERNTKKRNPTSRYAVTASVIIVAP